MPDRVEEGRCNKETVVNYSFIILLAILVIVWVIVTLIKDPSSQNNSFMRFLHDQSTSKIYVIFICGTLIFRSTTAIFFGYALWKMYKTMKEYSDDNQGT